MKLGRPAWGAIALVVAGALFFAATNLDVYNATSPREMTRQIFGPAVIAFAHPWWLSLHIWLRKAYSVVAFALVGFTLNRALPPTRRAGLRAALIVAAYSLAIEIVQRLFVAPEPDLESALDVGCGALGGWLAVVADRSFATAARRPRASRSAAHDPH